MAAEFWPFPAFFPARSLQDNDEGDLRDNDRLSTGKVAFLVPLFCGHFISDKTCASLVGPRNVHTSHKAKYLIFTFPAGGLMVKCWSIFEFAPAYSILSFRQRILRQLSWYVWLSQSGDSDAPFLAYEMVLAVSLVSLSFCAVSSI